MTSPIAASASRATTIARCRPSGLRAAIASPNRARKRPTRTPAPSKRPNSPHRSNRRKTRSCAITVAAAACAPRREDRRPRRDNGADDAGDAPVGFDASVLPPAISIPRDEPAEAPVEAAEAKPRRARAPRRPRPPADDAGETLETMG